MNGTLAVIGLGLIGGSVGSAARRAGWRVVGYDQSPEHAAAAVERGLVDEIAPGPATAAAGAGIVMLAVPVSAVCELLPTVAAALGPTGIVLDAASVKRPVVAAMERIEPADRAVGGHPLAGSERSGPGAARADLLRGAPFVLTPTGSTSEATLLQARRFVQDLGAVPVVAPAEEHDRVLARTSHLPQLLATVLAIVTSGSGALGGSGLRDMTRLAGSDAAMWEDILTSNRENVVAALDEFLQSLAAAREIVAGGQEGEIAALMVRGNEAAAQLREDRAR